MPTPLQWEAGLWRWFWCWRAEWTGNRIGGEGSSTQGARGVSLGESGGVGAFWCISVQQLSKTILLASHCTTEMEEAAVWSMNLHENQCGQPKHEIDAASWQGRSGSWRGRREERGEGSVEEKRWGGGVHWSPLEWDALLLSWATRGSWGRGNVGGETGVKFVDVVMKRCYGEFDK